MRTNEKQMWVKLEKGQVNFQFTDNYSSCTYVNASIETETQRPELIMITDPFLIQIIIMTYGGRILKMQVVQLKCEWPIHSLTFRGRKSIQECETTDDTNITVFL